MGVTLEEIVFSLMRHRWESATVTVPVPVWLHKGWHSARLGSQSHYNIKYIFSIKDGYQ